MRVYTDMTADLFHRGHVEFLRSAKSLYDDSILIVGVHSDNTCASYKRKPIFSMDDRVAIIKSCRFVDEVVPNAPLIITDKYLDQYNIDKVIAANCPSGIENTKFYKTNYCVPIRRNIVTTIPYYSGISTTYIINKIKESYET